MHKFMSNPPLEGAEILAWPRPFIDRFMLIFHIQNMLSINVSNIANVYVEHKTTLGGL